jgi:hypothetical protein
MHRPLKHNGAQLRGEERRMAEDAQVKCDPIPNRPARDGEVCCCGKPATKVVLTDDLGPVPYCGTPGEGHHPSDCPPWCANEDHEFPYGRNHRDIGHSIPLDFLPERSPLMVGLTKEPNKPACIDLIGVDDQLAGYLTAYEAEKLAEILRDLAATLRDDNPAQAR